jgi:hypothetical protein
MKCQLRQLNLVQRFNSWEEHYYNLWSKEMSFQNLNENLVVKFS